MNKITNLVDCRILVVEDDIDQLLHLEVELSNLGFKNVIYSNCFNEAVNHLENFKLDLVFSDYYLDLGKTALDLLMVNLNTNNIPFLIRSVDYSNQVLDKIIDYTNIDFISKSAKKFDVYKAIKILLSNTANREIFREDLLESFFVKQRQNFVKIQTSSIELIMVDGKYLDIYTIDKKKFTIRSSLNSFLSRLPRNIIRTRQNSAVNINHIKHVNNEDMSVTTKNLTSTLSRSFKAKFISKFVLK